MPARACLRAEEANKPTPYSLLLACLSQLSRCTDGVFWKAVTWLGIRRFKYFTVGPKVTGVVEPVSQRNAKAKKRKNA